MGWRDVGPARPVPPECFRPASARRVGRRRWVPMADVGGGPAVRSSRVWETATPDSSPRAVGSGRHPAARRLTRFPTRVRHSLRGGPNGAPSGWAPCTKRRHAGPRQLLSARFQIDTSGRLGYPPVSPNARLEGDGNGPTRVETDYPCTFPPRWGRPGRVVGIGRTPRRQGTMRCVGQNAAEESPRAAGHGGDRARTGCPRHGPSSPRRSRG